MKKDIFYTIYFLIVLAFIITNEFIYKFPEAIRYLFVFVMLAIALIFNSKIKLKK